MKLVLAVFWVSALTGVLVAQDSDGDGMVDSVETSVGRDPAGPDFSAVFVRDGLEELAPGPLLDQDTLWSGDAGALSVVSGVAVEGARHLRLESTGALVRGYRLLPDAGARTCWVDLQMRQDSVGADPALDPQAAVVFYFTSGGQLRVLNAGEWETLAHEPVDPVEWQRVTLKQDFLFQQWSIWLNGVEMANGLKFANDLWFDMMTELRMERMEVGSVSLDDLNVGSVTPPGLAGAGGVTYGTWAAGIGWEQAADAGAGEDPDGDGVPNALECLLGRDPLLAEGVPAVASGRDEVKGEGFVAMDLWQDLSVTDLRPTLRLSDDLVSWEDAVLGADSVTVLEDTGGRQRLRYRFPVAGGRRFGQLRVLGP